jgi:hypothetical protein
MIFADNLVLVQPADKLASIAAVTRTAIPTIWVEYNNKPSIADPYKTQKTQPITILKEVLHHVHACSFGSQAVLIADWPVLGLEGRTFTASITYHRNYKQTSPEHSITENIQSSQPFSTGNIHSFWLSRPVPLTTPKPCLPPISVQASHSKKQSVPLFRPSSTAARHQFIALSIVPILTTFIAPRIPALDSCHLQYYLRWFRRYIPIILTIVIVYPRFCLPIANNQ